MNLLRNLNPVNNFQVYLKVEKSTLMNMIDSQKEKKRKDKKTCSNLPNLKKMEPTIKFTTMPSKANMTLKVCQSYVKTNVIS
jgi:hypothetical protein